MSGTGDAEVRYISPSYTKLTGYTPGKLTTTFASGAPALKLIHPGDRDRVLGFLRDLKDGKKGTITYRFRRNDGHDIWLESVAEVRHQNDIRRDSGSAHAEVVVVSRDITARITSEQASGQATGVLDTGPGAMIIIGADRLISLVNTQAERLFGYHRDELIGQSPYILVPERFRPTQTGNRDAFQATPAIWPLGDGRELSGLRKDGSEMPLEISLDPVSTTDGLLVIVSIVDVTTRRKAEVEAQLLHTVVEGARDYGIFMLDPDGNVLTWNDGVARMKGYSANEIIGQNFSRFFTPEEVAAGHPAQELRIAEAEGKFEDEGWRVRRDGSRFFANILITPLRDKNGSLRGFSKLTRDITERRAAEELLRKSEKDLRQLADAMPQIVWTALASGEIDYCNHQWWEYTGSSGDDAPGPEHVAPILHPDDVPAYLSVRKNAMAAGVPFEIQCRFRNRHTGEYRWHLGRALPLRGETGEIGKWVGTFTDIDDHKRLSEELERRVEERTEALRRSLVETTTLLKEVHHRVKNNLQVICSLLSMQIACSQGDEFARPLNDAHSRVLAMSLIHEQIYQSDTLADLDFGEYIALLSERLFSTYCVDPNRIQLKLSVEPILLTMHQAIPCGLILNELISNSLKHGFSDGRSGFISITLRKLENRHVELALCDNGIGFPADFRWENSSSLGMQVVTTLIRQLRGDLTVTGDGGASFRFSWKLSDGNSLRSRRIAPLDRADRQE
jgi:PAS domain S-box-containing protein